LEEEWHIEGVKTMADEMCRTCKFVRAIDEEKGVCKVAHAERHVSSNSMMNEVEVINGWPKVKLDDSACGEWKIKN
jgi:hypothetical protein